MSNNAYAARELPSEDGKAVRFSVERDGAPLSVEEVLTAWREDGAFRRAYTALLLDNDYEGYFWEHPPLTRDRLAEPYEFVLIPTSILSRLRPNSTAFAKYFDPAEPVVYFNNLGGDAELVVPCPVGEPIIYTHLASFLRHAPPEQGDAFWQRVSERCRALVNDRPRWLSTAGLGVSWLHVRLDTQPRYYKYGPYRRWPL